MEFLFFSFSSLPQTLKLLFDQDFEISGQNKYIYIYNQVKYKESKKHGR